MNAQRGLKSVALLAGCLGLLLLGLGGPQGAFADSAAVRCVVGTGVTAQGFDPVLHTSFGVDCPHNANYAYAWIACPGASQPLECFGSFRATADRRGVTCHETGSPGSAFSQYCTPAGGGGGGGGGCALAQPGPQETVAVGIDGGPYGLAVPKSSFVLRRTEDGANNVSFLMEEWALLGTFKNAAGGEPRLHVLKSSSPTFAAAKSKDLEQISRLLPKRNARGARGAEQTVLIVEAPIHPHNSRFAPMPKLDVSNDNLPSGIQPGVVLVRADFTGSEDRPQKLEVLYARGSVSEELIDLVRDRLRLRWDSMSRHRTIAFALVRTGDALDVTSLAMVMPKCCCGGVFCV